jgi:hypothetical protein
MSESDNPCPCRKNQSIKIIGKQNNNFPDNNRDIHRARRRVPEKSQRNNKKKDD